MIEKGINMRYSLVIMAVVLGISGVAFGCSGGCGTCAYWNGEECLPWCNPSYCENCDGQGHCIVCNATPYQECCSGQCYDIRVQKCCQAVGYGYVCNNNDTCCNGQCCNPLQCKSCVNGVCKSNCDPNLCQVCDGQGHCIVCNGNMSKCCMNGQCKNRCGSSCCGDDQYCCGEQACCAADEVCCYYLDTLEHYCSPPCRDEVIDTTSCSENNEDDYKCTGCQQITAPTCGTYRDYTGLQIKACYDGCPQFDWSTSYDDCYREKRCFPMLHSNSVCVECEGEEFCAGILDIGPPGGDCETIGECIVQIVCDIIKTCFQCERGSQVVSFLGRETCNCQ